MKRILAALVTVVLSMPCFAQTERPKVEATESNVIATVLGKKITEGERARLNGLIFGALLQQYAQDNKLEPTQAEMDAYARKAEQMEKQVGIKFQADRNKLTEELKSSNLSNREREQKASELKAIETILTVTSEIKGKSKEVEDQTRLMKRQMAQQFITSWKINKALYAKYGGRVIFQQTGAEPIDAYRDFLREQEKAGRFQILDKQYESGFWRYYPSDMAPSVSNKEEDAKLINTPWWMMDAPVGK